MADKFVNLSLETTGSAGTEGDPYSFADFLTYLGTSPAATDFYFYGSHSGTDYVDYYDAGLVGNHTIRPYYPETPWRLDINYWGIKSAMVVYNGIINCSSELEINRCTYNTCILYATDYIYVRSSGNANGCIISAGTGILTDGPGNSVFQDNLIKAPYISDYYSGPTSVAFNRCAIDCASYTSSNTTYTDCQQDWTAPAFPAWNEEETSEFSSAVLLADVTTPPRPGNAPYTGYETGLFDEQERSDIGACFFEAPIPTTLYVNLDLETSGGDGTEYSPWNATEFRDACIATTIPAGTTVLIRGMHDYGSDPFLFDAAGAGVIFKNMLTDPWRIRASNIVLGNPDAPVALEYERGILEASEDFVLINEYQTMKTLFIRAALRITFDTGGYASYGKGCNFIAPTIVNAVMSIPELQDSILDTDLLDGYPDLMVSDKCLFTVAVPAGTHTDAQGDWTPPTWPEWDAYKYAFAYTIMSGILTPPAPGLAPYTGYATDLFGGTRVNIGAMFTPASSGMDIELKDESTGTVTSRAWELYNRMTEEWEVIGDGSATIVFYFDMGDARYAQVAIGYYEWQVRLTVENDGGSDTVTKTFEMIPPPPT